MARIAKKQPLTEIDLVILRTGATRRDRNALPWPNALKSDAKARTAAAIALLKRGLLAEVPSAKKSAAWRISPNGSPLMLIVTQAGVAALEPTTSGQSPAVAAKRATTKRETIVALLQSKGGASLKDMMAATGWQAHSIRGFLSGTVAKRLGHAVRSIKNDGEDRRYHRRGVSDGILEQHSVNTDGVGVCRFRGRTRCSASDGLAGASHSMAPTPSGTAAEAPQPRSDNPRDCLRLAGTTSRRAVQINAAAPCQTAERCRPR